ncbi:procathepsin L-like [Watersipora subatra]|uniref:procathepsin L-like n=1 Tax=Watersipora subatra TaxID=2589382 RepID=UPI00355C399A
MKSLVILAVVVLAVNAGPAMKWFEVQPALDASKDARLSADHLQTHWETFKKQHSKSYSESEEKSRYQKFVKNFATVMQHNSEQVMGLHSYSLGLNKYSDLDNFEVRTKMNGYKKPENYKRSGSTYLPPAAVTSLPDAVDWRSEGYVTPVKDQGQCGSCWAFSTTGSLEGQHFRQSGSLTSLSEQNLVDCSISYGNDGCNGGLMDQAFQYIKDNKGIDTEQIYPYTAEDGTCEFVKSGVGAEDTGFVDIPEGDEEALKKAVANVGPVSVAIDASHESFQLYSSGVYDERECSTEQLDHGVLVVGYGTEDGQDYWLVKNSWGESWGLQGYIKMSRNRDNQCGIASSASYPLV